MNQAGQNRMARAGLIGCGALLAGVILVGLIFFVLNSGPTAIKSVELARDYQNEQAVGVGTVFQPTDNPLHCVIRLERQSVGTKVKVVWTAVDANGQQNYKLSEREIVVEGSNQNTIDAFLQLSTPWPPGSYKVDVYLDDRLNKTVMFSIANSA
jgi:hypothetical protein